MGPGKLEPSVVALGDLLFYLFIVKQSAVAGEEVAAPGTGGESSNDEIENGVLARGHFGTHFLFLETRPRLV